MAVAASNTVDHSNFYSQAHANIYNLLNNRSNVADPLSSEGTRKFVFTREPKDIGRNFQGYPAIIVPPIDLSQVNLTLDASKSTTTFTINVTVWASDKTGSSLTQPPGPAQLDSISNDILSTLNNKSNRDTLRNQGMANFTVTSSASDFDEQNEQMIFVRDFQITFKQVLKVVA